MKKTLALALALLFVLALFAGCASGRPAETAAPETKTTEQNGRTETAEQPTGESSEMRPALGLASWEPTIS